MSLKRIRLELARTPQFPDGSARHGYEFTAPLDLGGKLDALSWRRARNACAVRRFWPGSDDEHGRLLHRRDGKWVFSYRPGDDDDEPIFRFDSHSFRVGDYVSITEHDGVTRPFKVVTVKPVMPIAFASTPRESRRSNPAE
jgi:hypothetical protein